MLESQNQATIHGSGKNEDDPGAYVLQFGIHAGRPLRNVPDRYRYWATKPENRKYSWHPQFCVANGGYEIHLRRTRAPGAYCIPFGKFENKRLDEVPDAVRAWAVHEKRTQPEFTPFVDANTRFEASLPPERHINSEKFWVNKRSGARYARRSRSKRVGDGHIGEKWSQESPVKGDLVSLRLDREQGLSERPADTEVQAHSLSGIPEDPDCESDPEPYMISSWSGRGFVKTMADRMSKLLFREDLRARPALN
ncbi:hypothetical protein BV22DRAFT_1039202 [Leucogyrophana mollusca]|uniref:Uncharacterized protein n=1 Tax=Leucogyrophana mollusca TaxID=85980 RepID=A0ACB8B621_9AGAM|nr:hypothetical protein BV22DRAFT_1039202 [Leucogyrophana mollusca]